MVSAGSSEEDLKAAYLRLSGVHSWDSDLETVKCSYFSSMQTVLNVILGNTVEGQVLFVTSFHN